MKTPMLIAALLLTLGPAAGAELTAVTSFSILGDMVQRVGGERVAVTSIVGPDADSHVYQPTPADAAGLMAADIFFVNGLGFEGWLDRLVGATGFAGPVVTLSDGITPRANEEEEEGHDHDGHDHGPNDPHAWQDLTNGAVYVRNIATALCRLDQPGCPVYEANAAIYIADIQTLDAEVKARLAAIPAAERKVITTHDAFGYFGAAYGVTFLAPEGISTESEASAATVARLIDQVRSEGVKALFIENMSDPRLVQQIARETGAVLGGQLYADALSSATGPAPTYLDMFRHNVDLLVPALQGK